MIRPAARAPDRGAVRAAGSLADEGALAGAGHANLHPCGCGGGADALGGAIARRCARARGGRARPRDPGDGRGAGRRHAHIGSARPEAAETQTDRRARGLRDDLDLARACRLRPPFHRACDRAAGAALPGHELQRRHGRARPQPVPGSARGTRRDHGEPVPVDRPDHAAGAGRSCRRRLSRGARRPSAGRLCGGVPRGRRPPRFRAADLPAVRARLPTARRRLIRSARRSRRRTARRRPRCGTVSRRSARTARRRCARTRAATASAPPP